MVTYPDAQIIADAVADGFTRLIVVYLVVRCLPLFFAALGGGRHLELYGARRGWWP